MKIKCPICETGDSELFLMHSMAYHSLIFNIHEMIESWNKIEGNPLIKKEDVLEEYKSLLENKK